MASTGQRTGQAEGAAGAPDQASGVPEKGDGAVHGGRLVAKRLKDRELLASDGTFELRD